MESKPIKKQRQYENRIQISTSLNFGKLEIWETLENNIRKLFYRVENGQMQCLIRNRVSGIRYRAR
jgi:hypothetical protein